MRTELRARLLTALSGDPEGTPRWIRELAEGDDAGHFAEDGAAWTVHGSMATLVAGIRALLLQALHPGAMAGVHDWSSYREDPLGRLAGTVRWVVCVTYGSTEQAARETARVGRLHARVAGSYRDGAGAERSYRADDGGLAAWVHLAFTDAFLTCQQTWGPPTRGRGPCRRAGSRRMRDASIPGGADAYVAEWAVAGRLMRVDDPPATADELRGRLAGYLKRGELRGDERVHDVVAFLRRPPVGVEGAAGLGYRLLFEGAVATIPAPYRRLLGVRRSPLPVVTATRAVLWIAGRALASGDGRRAQDWARLRLRRLEAQRAA
ncbi:oxygenase MpaB family protein [Agrococcus sp. Marseille-P2731]|uniref:oxygenase MpaB family protein n=1 Tax=Agrococcus sp. Marseille-P2731 TaxID=1841862 RepID=UPI000931FE88|nr:oxygenase MpaB family protein [Agrococcus sp. Marseille-P2731]